MTDHPSPALHSSPPLQGERVAFTGTLASMTHREAFELVERHGGAASAHVSRQTTVLVVGEEGWPLEADGALSRKLDQTMALREQGLPIRVLQESEWLQWLGLEERRRDLSRLYTPAMLSELLKIPVSTVRRWHRLGLVRPVKSFGRLPYFDFLEVSAARKVMELVASGISPQRLGDTLDHLARILGRERFPQARLALVEMNARLLIRDEAGLLEARTGQRVFDFDPRHAEPSAPETSTHTLIPFPETGEPTAAAERAQWTAEQWHEEGDTRLEAGEPAAAIEAFRMALMERPDRPETHFALAEALYRLGNREGALERYYNAVEQDPDYVEAWVQLGCLQAEAGQWNAAIDAFQLALNVHPEYPDAHWQLAEALCQVGRREEANTHWQQYLQYDSVGPCADLARQRLGAPAEAADGSAV